jgi:hypothetical protein
MWSTISNKITNFIGVLTPLSNIVINFIGGENQIVLCRIKLTTLVVIGTDYIGRCKTTLKVPRQQSEAITYTKVVPFKEKSSFHFVVL